MTTTTRATISTTQLELETSNSEWSAARQLLDLKAVMAFERGGAQLSRALARKSMCWARDSLEKLPIKLTMENVGAMTILACLVIPRAFTYWLVYPIFRLVFGTLYPAYASYRAVRTKNVKEYVKWMMYWIVFALFTCAETFTDVFFSFWFPFYYEIKIILVLWLLSPATKGSSILYRRFVHPALCRREAEIDEALARATEQGYSAVLQLGTKGVNYATTMLMQTAIKNLPNVVPLSTSQSDSAISSSASNRQLPTTEKTTTDGRALQSNTSRRHRRRTKSVEALHGEVRHVTTYVVDESEESMSLEEDLEMSYVLSADDTTNDNVDQDVTDDFKKPQAVKKTRKATVERENSVTRRKPRTRGQSARTAGFDSDFSD